MKIKSVFNKSFALLLAIVMILSSIVVLAPAYATVKTFKCSNCHGLGSLLCNACSGSGKLAYYDVWVHKYLYTSCPKCLGAGRVTCSWCDGYGSYSIDVPDPDTSTPPKTSIAKIISREAGFSVSWKAQTNKTTGYQIQYATNNKFSGGKAKTVNGKTNITITGLTQGKKYYIRVRTYRAGSDKNYYSAWSATKSVVTKKVAKPAKTTIAKIISRTAGFSVSWKKQTKNVTGYQIQYATNNKFKGGKTKSVKGATNTTVLNLLSAKKYFVRVRTFRTYGGKNYFSGWSPAKSVVTKTLPTKPATPAITKFDTDFAWAGMVSIYFKHDNNRTGCQLQVSKYSNFSNAELWTSCRNNTDTPYSSISKKNPWRWWLTNGVYGIINDCVEIQNTARYKEGTYYYRLRAFNRVNGKNYYSSWSNVVSAKLSED